MTDNLKLFIELNIAQIRTFWSWTETSCPYIYLCYVKLNKKFQDTITIMMYNYGSSYRNVSGKLNANS